MPIYIPKQYCELFFGGHLISCIFACRTVYTFKIPTKWWFKLIAVCLIWKSMNSCDHKHIYHHQNTKFHAHKIKLFHGIPFHSLRPTSSFRADNLGFAANAFTFPCVRRHSHLVPRPWAKSGYHHLVLIAVGGICNVFFAVSGVPIVINNSVVDIVATDDAVTLLCARRAPLHIYCGRVDLLYLNFLGLFWNCNGYCWENF